MEERSNIMVVIYTQDETFIRNTLKDAEDILLDVYGSKFTQEILKTMDDRKVGASFRAKGGLLVRIVSSEDAQAIRKKEIEIGMMRA